MSNGATAGGRYARFIPSEEIDRVAQWRFGAVDESVRAAVALVARAEAAQAEANSPRVQALLEEARREAHALGFAEGHAQATREGRQQLDDYAAGEGRAAAERLASTVAAAQQGVAQSQEAMARSVLDIACALARQVLRHELADNPNALQPVVREALGMLLADGRVATVRLHPLDLDMLRQPLHEEFSGTSVAWLADPAIPAGGCVVECAGTVIDGRIEARWERAVAALGRQDAWAPAATMPPQPQAAAAVTTAELPDTPDASVPSSTSIDGGDHDLGL